jgi:hypothetical protein
MEEIDAEELRNTFKQMVAMEQEHPPAGYLGPGIWIRIQKRFRTRRTEWLLAAITALLGFVTLFLGNLFDLPGYAGFRHIFGNEILLGVCLSALGILRIVGLIINGARKNVTPHIRMFSAACGCLIFAGITYCFTLSGIFGWWVVIYPMFVVTELANVYSAAHDVGEANGRAN